MLAELYCFQFVHPPIHQMVSMSILFVDTLNLVTCHPISFISYIDYFHQTLSQVQIWLIQRFCQAMFQAEFRPLPNKKKKRVKFSPNLTNFLQTRNFGIWQTSYSTKFILIKVVLYIFFLIVIFNLFRLK